MRRSLTQKELSSLIAKAASKAFRSLFSAHPGTFYYCSLVTTGEALPPAVSAWSYEELAKIASNSQARHKVSDIKWSAGDSPFYGFGDEYFDSVRQAFASLADLNAIATEAEWEAEISWRLSAIELAMVIVDRNGVFGRGEDRSRVAVLVEVIPPDASNTARAVRLNPPSAIGDWLSEAAEPLA